MEHAMILVVDIPPNTTAAEAEALLNRPYEEGYYLATISAGDRFSARAFYRRRTKVDEREAALAVLRENKDKTVPQIRAALADAGVKRSADWVKQELQDIKGAGQK